MKKLIVIFLFVFTAGIMNISAQSAESVTKMLETKTVTVGQACYFTAVYLDLAGDDTSEAEAVSTLTEKGFINSSWKTEHPITMKQFSLLCSKTWKISASLLYIIFKSPRYAFKQMKALDIIPFDSSPNEKLSGTEVLNIYTKCIDAYSPKEGV